MDLSETGAYPGKLFSRRRSENLQKKEISRRRLLCATRKRKKAKNNAEMRKNALIFKRIIYIIV